MNLSHEQQVVVNHCSGNAVVVAGAGSGKTRCLIERCAKMIEDGVDPASILIFTFTKKAAKEIKERLVKKLGELGSSVVACTIHSLALKIVREYYEDIGYAQRPVIWGSEKIKRLIRNTFDEHIKNIDPSLDDDVKAFKKLEKKAKKQDDPMGLYEQSLETQRISLSTRLHNLKVSLVEEFGDDTLDQSGKSDETFFNPILLKDRDFPPSKEMLSEVNNKENEREGFSTAYFSIDHDDPLECRKDVLKKKTKSLVNMITNSFRPIPSQISGIELKDARKEWNSKPELNESLLDGVVSVAVQTLRGKQACNAIEFDDMIPGAIRVLTLNPFNDYTTIYKHVMVDEYQDVNDTNVEFIKLLSQNSESLMVVGDDDQSIYAFRGGNTQHILDFPEKFNAETLFLTTNYRCVPEIVNFSNTLISNNENRYPKKMSPNRSPEESYNPIQTINPTSIPNYQFTNKFSIWGDDANFKGEVYDEILHSISGLTGFLEVKPSEIAILARNNFQLLQFSAFMSKAQAGIKPDNRIKFEFLSSQSTFKNPTINKIHNWFNFVMSETDTVSLQEVIVEVISGFGNAATRHLNDAIKKEPKGSLKDWFDYLWAQKRYRKESNIGKQLSIKLSQYNTLMNNIETKTVEQIFLETLPLAGISQLDILSYENFIKNSLDQSQNPEKGSKKNKDLEKEELKKLGLYLKLYEYHEALKRLTGITKNEIDPLDEFDPDDPFFVMPSQEELDRVSAINEMNRRDPSDYVGKEGLQKFLDEINTEAETEDVSEGVSLGTIHSSKGKEWEHVFVIGMTRDIIPSPMNIVESENSGGEEEERRLMYVAMTRAKDNLYLCWEQQSMISKFILEIFKDSENNQINIPNYAI